MTLSKGLYENRKLTLDEGLRINMFLPLETTGELALLSLKKIGNTIEKTAIGNTRINDDIRRKLVEELVKANLEFRTIRDKDWNCITPYAVQGAVERLGLYLVEKMTLNTSGIDAIEAERQISRMKRWFFLQYTNLIYDTGGKIPKPIIRNMSAQFGMWLLGNQNIFDYNIKTFILETSKQVSLNENCRSDEEIWKALRKYS